MYDFKPFDKVLTRDFENENWTTNFFSHYDDGVTMTLGNCSWRFCIPFQGNEHLVGTTDTPESNWKPQMGTIVAMSDDRKDWRFCIYVRKEYVGDKTLYIGKVHSSSGLEAPYKYCEPARNHFDFITPDPE